MSNELNELYSYKTVQAQKLFEELQQKNFILENFIRKRYQIPFYETIFWVNHQDNHTVPLTILAVSFIVLLLGA